MSVDGYDHILVDWPLWVDRSNDELPSVWLAFKNQLYRGLGPVLLNGSAGSVKRASERSHVPRREDGSNCVIQWTHTHWKFSAISVIVEITAQDLAPYKFADPAVSFVEPQNVVFGYTILGRIGHDDDIRAFLSFAGVGGSKP